MSNPFNQKTTSYHDWEVLKDLFWHCVKCELQSGQAKTWQIWRQKGIQLDVDERERYYKRIFCRKCNLKTVHRKLKSLIILEETKLRSRISPKLATKIKNVYSLQEAFYLRTFPSKELEVDHKFPQIRWNKNEGKYSDSISDSEIKSKFVLLSRSNNLLKSRYCERCFRTNLRGTFPGIYYWYEGDEKWNGENKYDEKGCIGCFWYDPYKWREQLSKRI